MEEEKQLDFNQPFLSVRRFTPKAVSPETKKNKKTDNPQPKISKPPVYKSELKSGPIRNAGTIPFVWEKTPGNPRGENNLEARVSHRTPLAPKLPPGRNFDAKQQASDNGSEFPSTSSQNVLKSDETVDNHDEMEEKRSWSSEDGEEDYVDALDTLSRSESFFLNCSVSGVSGLDGLDAEPHGVFSKDPQAHDLMMGRFLPAAKAMASESPQYIVRKQAVVREQRQPREITNLACVEKNVLLKPNAESNIRHYVEESDDEDEDYERPGSSSFNVCGLLPRFCLQMNPVLGLQKHTRVPVSSVRRTRAKSSYATTSFSESENEHVRNSFSDQSSTTTEPKEELNQISYGSDSQKLEGSSLYKRLQGSGDFPQSPQRAKKDSAAIYKGPHTFRELLAFDSSNWESDSGSPIIEKMLYVDTLHKLKSPGLSSDSLDMKELIDHQSGNHIEQNVVSYKEKMQQENFEPVPLPKGLKKANEFAFVEHSVTTAKSPQEGQIEVKSDEVEIKNCYSITSGNDERMDIKNKRNGHSRTTLPPPLPPSESWLKRALPSASSRSSSLGPNFQSKLEQGFKTPPVDPKWETIVRAKNVQLGHLRYSEELLSPIPEA